MTAEDPAAVLIDCIRDMPDGHVRALAAAIGEYSQVSDAARRRVLDVVAHPGYRQVANRVLDLWASVPSCSGSSIALALATGIGIRQLEEQGESVDIVATGPASAHVSVRQTRAVLLELIGRATRELIIVSYAAYRVSELVDAIGDAQNRGVTVRLVLETTADSGGTLSRDAIEAFDRLRERVETYIWPLDQRPAGSRLHAKTVVADDEWAFVTSANLTGHALDQNLEIGVLLRGGTVPGRLGNHFRALIARGTLKRSH